MKATLEFDLDFVEDNERYKLMNDATKLNAILINLQDWLKNKVQEDLEDRCYELVLKRLNDSVRELGV